MDVKFAFYCVLSTKHILLWKQYYHYCYPDLKALVMDLNTILLEKSSEKETDKQKRKKMQKHDRQKP